MRVMVMTMMEMRQHPRTEYERLLVLVNRFGRWRELFFRYGPFGFSIAEALRWRVVQSGLNLLFVPRVTAPDIHGVS
jgi:hypothetical protein